MPNPEYEARGAELNNELKREALRSVGRTMLAGLGIGAAARGVIGLSQMASTSADKAKRNKRVGINTDPTRISIPQLAVEEKLAGLDQPTRQPTNADPGSPAMAEFDNWRKTDRGFGGRLAGDKATSKLNIPWYLPAAVVGGGTALYGGYKLTDWLLNKRHKADNEDELALAKKRYQHAIMSQYTPKQVEKWSSADVSQGLDILYDATMKRNKGDFSKVGNALDDIAGAGLGAYGLLAATLALGTGIGTYHYVKSRSPEERLKKVLQQRQRERWLRQPPEMNINTNKINVSVPKFPEDNKENENQLLLGKVASFVKTLFN